MTKTVLIVLASTAVVLPALDSTAPQAAAIPSAAEIVVRIDQANAARTTKLQSYFSTRRYSGLEPGHPPDAQMVVSMRYDAPSKKTFTTVSTEGTGWIERRVFRGLMNAEQEAAAGVEHLNSAISTANYDAAFLRSDQYRGRQMYVLALSPKRKDKYLWKGTAWIDTQDFAIARIQAEPAVSPSFWIVRAPFVREYQRIDGFWLPLLDETHSQIRIIGEYVLHIEYSDYHLTVKP